MDPASMLIASGITSAVSGGIGAASSIIGGERRADAEESAARAQAERQERQNRRSQARTRAAMGARGAQVSGTPLELLTDQAMEAEEQRQLTMFGGRQRAARARQQGFGRAIGQVGQGAGTMLSDFATAGMFNDGGPPRMT